MIEDKIKRLEEIVKIFEKGNLSLEENLKLFEEATLISKECYSSLEKCKLRVVEIKKQFDKISEEEL